MKTKLLVVPNFSTFKRGYNEDGSYILVHPQYYTEREGVLWGHWCSNLGFAFGDLQYPNRKDFLNEIFGVDNWTFEFYEFTTMEDFKQYISTINNESIDVQIIDDLFAKYKGIDKHL
jgi:hypothetical protein